MSQQAHVSSPTSILLSNEDGEIVAHVNHSFTGPPSLPEFIAVITKELAAHPLEKPNMTWKRKEDQIIQLDSDLQVKYFINELAISDQTVLIPGISKANGMLHVFSIFPEISQNFSSADEDELKLPSVDYSNQQLPEISHNLTSTDADESSPLSKTTQIAVYILGVDKRGAIVNMIKKRKWKHARHPYLAHICVATDNLDCLTRDPKTGEVPIINTLDKSNIPIVTKAWIRRCCKQKHTVETKHYELHTISGVPRPHFRKRRKRTRSKPRSLTAVGTPTNPMEIE